MKPKSQTEQITNTLSKSSVQYLIDSIEMKLGKAVYDLLGNEFEQAKKQHKNEIINAVDGFPVQLRGLNGEEYYNQLYNL